MSDYEEHRSSLVGVHHVQVAMPEGQEEAGRHFYGDLLGLREVPKPAELAARGGCWFRARGLEVHLGVESNFRPARKAHPAFRVHGLRAVRDKLASAGTELVDDVQLDGHDRFYAYDPFGNRLEFIEERPAAPQT